MAIIGRNRELDFIERALDSRDGGLRGVVLGGEPGIGKTTLWHAALDLAATRNLLVLSCQPVQAEAKFGFAALTDLLAPAGDSVLSELPRPQRLALEVALLRASPQGAGPDRRAVATAVQAALGRLAQTSAVVLAIDDIQWLDRPSASVLAFALRRLDRAPVRLVCTVRVTGERAPDPLGLDKHPSEQIDHLRLQSLTLAGVQQLISTQLGFRFARPTLRRIADASGGNPLFALELARALGDTNARPGPGDPLPVPDTLGALLERRLARLPPAAQEAMLAAAALSPPDADVVAGALGASGTSGLRDAENAGVLAVRDGTVLFSHPLLAATVYSSASPDRRRAAHRRLAAVVADPEQRARHLALGATQPSEDVASALETAARSAERRGALESALELADLACRLTPGELAAAGARRRLALAELTFRGGDGGQARMLVDEVLEEATGDLRARALELLARVLHMTGTASEAVSCCEQALAVAGDDLALTARVHATLARVSWDDLALARRHAERALELLERVPAPEPADLSHALAGFIEAEVYTGRGLPAEAVSRALELERVAPPASVSDRVSAALGPWLKVCGDFAGARHWLELTHRAALEEGDEASLPYVVGHLPQLELWTGHWEEAERRALEHLELAEDMKQPDQRRQALFNLALVHAHRGRAEEARREAEELRFDAEREGDSWGLTNAMLTLGFLELSLGHPGAAAELLASGLELCESIGRTEPLRGFADYAEALLELGRLDDADRVITVLEGRAAAAGRAPLQALAASCRALLAAERGDLDGALGAITEALAHHELVPVPFDVARTQLAAGRIRRRRGERRLGRDSLEQAIEAFERLGAPLWADRARVELQRIPIRRSASDELTATEAQVATLSAQGRTNREVAQALFMSPKTVEANLMRVYRKLGVRSRAELGLAMAQRGLEGAVAKP